MHKLVDLSFTPIICPCQQQCIVHIATKHACGDQFLTWDNCSKSRKHLRWFFAHWKLADDLFLYNSTLRRLCLFSIACSSRCLLARTTSSSRAQGAARRQVWQHPRRRPAAAVRVGGTVLCQRQRWDQRRGDSAVRGIRLASRLREDRGLGAYTPCHRQNCLEATAASNNMCTYRRTCWKFVDSIRNLKT